MSAFVDTNILVRHFTGDPPDQAERATRFLAASDYEVDRLDFAAAYLAVSAEMSGVEPT